MEGAKLSPTFPRLDLGRRDVTTLEFWCFIDWTAEFDEMFQGVFEEQGSFLSGTVYSRRKQRHVISADFALAEIGEPPTKKLYCFVGYNASAETSSWHIPPPYRRETTFWALARRIETQCNLHCKLQFEFDERADEIARDLWFPLPTRLEGGGEEAALYEIRGVEGARLYAEDMRQIEYSFKLRRPFNGAISLQIEFSLASKIHSRLPEIVLAQGLEIATSLAPQHSAGRR